MLARFQALAEATGMAARSATGAVQGAGAGARSWLWVAMKSATRGAMSARRRGNVINVSAGNAFFPTPGSCVYGASKAFVNSFTEALAYELRGDAVEVTAVCPGFTRTDAQHRLGLNRDAFPRSFWTDPEAVAHSALRAATRGSAVSSLSLSDAFAAFAGRHVPRRLLIPLIARANDRFASG